MALATHAARRRPRNRKPRRDLRPQQFPLFLVDDGDPGYSETVGWTRLTGLGDAYEGDCSFAAAGSGLAVATWRFDGHAVGMYEVFAAWHSQGDAATNARYRVYDGATLRLTVRVDQTAAPTGGSIGGVPFNSLGVVLLADGPLRVTLDDDGNGYVFADAVRVESTIASVGALGATLAPATLAGSATSTDPVASAGALAATLAGATLAGSAASADPGASDAALAATLASATVDGSGSAAGSGESEAALAATLSAATLDGSGTFTAAAGSAGSLAATLADATLAGTAAFGVSASLSITLANATLDGSGDSQAPASASASLAATLAAATLSGSGSASGVGDSDATLSVTLAAATIDGSGAFAAAQAAAGALAATLADAVLAGSGVSGVAPSMGSLAATLADATLVGAGGATVPDAAAAALAVTLAAATLTGAGTATQAGDAVGTLARTLASATLVGAGVSTGGEVPLAADFIGAVESDLHTSFLPDHFGEALYEYPVGSGIIYGTKFRPNKPSPHDNLPYIVATRLEEDGEGDTLESTFHRVLFTVYDSDRDDCKSRGRKLRSYLDSGPHRSPFEWASDEESGREIGALRNDSIAEREPRTGANGIPVFMYHIDYTFFIEVAPA
jgi:hypothetical protein